MSQNEIIDLTLWNMDGRETEKAILFHDGSTVPTHEIERSLTGKTEKLKEFWLAKSVIEYEATGIEIPEAQLKEYTVTLPRWLAEEKGLI